MRHVFLLIATFLLSVFSVAAMDKYSIGKELFQVIRNNSEKDLVKLAMIESEHSLLSQFKNVINRGKDLGIDWISSAIVRIDYDESKIKETQIIYGAIRFKDKRNAYLIRFSAYIQLDQQVLLKNLYMPHVDNTADNVAKYSKYKPLYIKRCVESLKKSPIKPRIAVEKFCECSFNRILLEENCKELLESKFVQLFNQNCED